MNPHTDPKEIEAARFAGEVAETLRQAREGGRFEFLALSAPPHFLGLLRKEFDRHTRERLVVCRDKDYTLADARELAPFMKETLAAAEQASMRRHAWT